MTINMLVHDMRVIGRSPPVDKLLEVTAMNRLQDIATQSAEAARANQGIFWYVIMAHGMGAVRADKGGSMGIDLGEGLTVDNVDVFKALRGPNKGSLVNRIVLYVCGAAAHSYWNDRTYGDGAWLCSRLSVFSQAKVIASSWIQAYTYGDASGTGVLGPSDPPIDFGEWEGPVFEFTPDGNKRKLDAWEQPKQTAWVKSPAATP
jgi:hypothetical protein